VLETRQLLEISQQR